MVSCCHGCPGHVCVEKTLKYVRIVLPIGFLIDFALKIIQCTLTVMINYYNRSQKEKKKKGKGATTTIFKGVRSGLEDAIAPALNCGGKCRQAWFLTIILVINIKVFKDIKEACQTLSWSFSFSFSFSSLAPCPLLL